MSQTIWLLVTAHPDDESMFFIPTLRNLLRPNQEVNTAAGADGRRRRPRSDNDNSRLDVRLLCLSNGDYRDKSDGPIRTEEMHRACSLIGVQNGNYDVAAATVLNDKNMKDGPNEVWSCDLVSESVLGHIRKRVVPSICVEGDASSKLQRDYALSDSNEEGQFWVYVEKNLAQPSKSEKESKQTINLNLLTFDQGGVSRHPNHVDTFRGVQHILNEKCNISCHELESRARLWLSRGRDASKNDADSNVIELNVSAYTLRTIPNPLYKYFLWAFVDIIPHLFIFLLQTLWRLVYFLIGGFLGNKGGVQIIRPFSGIWASYNGKRLECRMMDPMLVWRAMAAHHSQFAWYRRLSVMFSRYTYINDLEILPIDNPCCGDPHDDDEEELGSLPPVVAIKEEGSASKSLLTLPQMDALREAVLPVGLHHRPWKRIYSLSRDGDSFVAFQKLMEDWSRKQRDQSTLLVIKTVAGDMIGGFADVPIVPSASNMIGSAARSCLFKLQIQKDCADFVVGVYGKHCPSSKKVLFSAPRRIIAFGGVDIDGRLDEGFGLCLSDGFVKGTTARCAAFRNEPLVSEQNGVFGVLDVEVWGFVSGQFCAT